MSLRRIVSCLACLLLALGGAWTGQAKTYSLVGGGGQLALGKHLPLPIQLLPPGVTGSVFPPVLVPANTAKVIQGTTAMTVRQKLTVPAGVLSRLAQQRTLGVFAQNPNLYAAATNLGWQWPAAPAVLSTGARTGSKTTTFTAWQGRIRYSNAGSSKFGGPARFAIRAGVEPQGLIMNAPVTLYAIAVPPTGNPPCTHPDLVPPFGGTFSNPACVAALVASWPNGTNFIGGPVGSAGLTTPCGAPIPGIGSGKFGAGGTVSFFVFPPTALSGLTNCGWSSGFPWTTGMLTISAPGADGGPEVFTITGRDNRTPGGAGSIQLVSGGLSLRAVMGPSANRGWVRLELAEVRATPTLSPAGLAAAAGIMLLAGGYALRRRFSA